MGYLDSTGLSRLVADAKTAFAAAAHGHSASEVTSGTFDVARIPTGTSATTVALGNHTHDALTTTEIDDAVAAAFA